MKKIEQAKNKLRNLSLGGKILLGFLTVLTIVIFFFYDYIEGPDSVFHNHVSDNSFIQGAYENIPNLIETIQIVTIAWLGYEIIKFVLAKVMGKTKKGETISKLLTSFLKYLIAIIALLVILSAWGTDVTTLLASAGILSLIIGLGAQSLIADIIAGVFIVFEDEYEVGDIVVIDGWRGTVSEIGIRSTRIVDAGGNIKIINNSEISSVINQTKLPSVAKCIMSIDYASDIPTVEKIIADNLDEVSKKVPDIDGKIIYKGVTELADSSINLLFVVQCKEENIYQVQRDMNKELMALLVRYNINIPFPQIVVNQATPAPETKEEK